ncbi:PaaI family thioesterase [Halococcus qingdaonensis]|uniref:PaaI family thioesterase n=1 Tax=Halococcus qingdaonensis TaxID=224402 RepID=UPI002116143C|nr:hotdog fold thioesterase [Halococcus qingdaonensis]
MDDIHERIANDPYCSHLGITLETLAAGRAVTALELDEALCNFHGTPHGGAIYSLADAAFAAASNAEGRTALALETNISYLAPPTVGETITAVAEESHDGGRTAEYDVRVSDAHDDPIATFRGRVYRPD